MHSYAGYCRSQLDCLILFEAACMGAIPRISQRLTEDERSEIKSGSIYIWDENEAGVKRWTDGKSWSTSRVSGPFLIYRELEPGNSQSSTRCQVKPYGLCKQSASITVGDSTKLHLIAYYKKEDVRAGTLMQPSMDLNFKDITAFLKKRNVGVSNTDSNTPPPMSPSSQMPISKPPMPLPHIAQSAVFPMYSPPNQMSASHPNNRARTPARVPVMYAPQGPPSPPYAARGPTPPLMHPKQAHSLQHIAAHPQQHAQNNPHVLPLVQLPPQPQQVPLFPQPPPAMVVPEAPGRSFDEDRRQLSLLDKSLSAY